VHEFSVRRRTPPNRSVDPNHARHEPARQSLLTHHPIVPPGRSQPQLGAAASVALVSGF